MELNKKNIVLIKYLNKLFPEFCVKAEYATKTDEDKLIVVQEKAGEKVVFFGDCEPLYNYYSIDIFGNSIKEALETSLQIGNLIGHNDLFKIQENNSEETWQVMIKQFINPQSVSYQDIRRISYNMTIQCVINLVNRKEIGVE